MRDPKTWAEHLDHAAAQPDHGQAFGDVLAGLFRAAENARVCAACDYGDNGYCACGCHEGGRR